MKDKLMELFKKRFRFGTRSKEHQRWLYLRGLFLLYIHLVWYQTQDRAAPIQFGEGDSREVPPNTMLEGFVVDFIDALVKEHPATPFHLQITGRVHGQRGLAVSILLANSGEVIHSEELGVVELWMLVGDPALASVARMIRGGATQNGVRRPFGLSTQGYDSHLSVVWKVDPAVATVFNVTASEMESLASRKHTA